MIVVLIIGGIIAGCLGGMGLGGGAVLIPILTLVCHMEQTTAQLLNMTAFLPGAVVAIIIHAKNHRIKWKQCLPIAIVGAVFAIAGSMLARCISSDVLKKLFALFIGAVAIKGLVCKKQ